MGQQQHYDINYEAEPTLKRFHRSDMYVRGIRGPIGSGKSVGCINEIIRRALEQHPGPDGVRRFRAAVIRNTYAELRSTTIKTWQDWLPDSLMPITYGAPITGWLKQPLPDGTAVELEVMFISLNRPQDIKKLLSLELTMAWINEAREIPLEIVDGVTSRLGRYPSKRAGGPSWIGLIMDTNPPDDDHWWYRMFEVEKPSNWVQFVQPSALVRAADGQYYPNPVAENVKNQALGYDYWLNMIPGKTRDWLNVYVMGNYGTVEDGKPIYPEYNDELHCAKQDLEPLRGLPLRLGWDFGLTPACAFFQVDPRGQIRVIDEAVSLDMGIRRFAQEVVKPRLLNEYAGMTIISHGDPAGTQRSQTQEDTCLGILEEEGIPTEKASTQEYVKRREAVAQYLTRVDVDGAPAFLLSPRCKVLRKGFNGAYKYDRIQVANEDRYKDKPAKNLPSHVHEGLQYGVMMINDGIQIRRTTVRPVQRRVRKYV